MSKFSWQKDLINGVSRYTNGHTVKGSVQEFPNGTASYWFILGTPAIAVANLKAAMSKVESNE